MSKTQLSKTVIYGSLIFMLGILASASFVYASKEGRAVAGGVATISEPRVTTSEADSPVSSAVAETTTVCTPIRVAVFKNRVHVQCSSAVGGISFFAAPTSDSANVARILSLLSTAQVAGRNVLIWYDPANTSGASFGCQTNDCRPINGVAFGQ